MQSERQAREVRITVERAEIERTARSRQEVVPGDRANCQESSRCGSRRSVRKNRTWRMSPSADWKGGSPARTTRLWPPPGVKLESPMDMELDGQAD
mmetsp:Transcript_34605/g.112559  ORF Transcript_34605/g.112559 Transcript_34605/m.112559 type:complete len:96 (+) Transcript_34605:978-1265(+)